MRRDGEVKVQLAAFLTLALDGILLYNYISSTTDFMKLDLLIYLLTELSPS
jgi:hypothetical protein